MKLNVIVPAYNESENVPYFYGRARQALDAMPGLDWNLVFINNSSDDDTIDQVMAVRAANPRVKIITLCRKFTLISVPGGELDEHGRKNGHYRHYTKADLVQKMERAGFRVIRAFTCGWPVHSLFYRQLMRHLPRAAVTQVGLGPYT